MTVSNKRRAARGLAAAFALTLACGDACLGAAELPPAAPADPSAAPAQPSGPVSILPAASDSAVREDPGIAVGDLAAPGVDSIGLIDVSAGGFSPQLWRGTDLELLKQLLPQLPRRSASPAVRQLARNLLLSPGAPPMASPASGAREDQPADNAALTVSQWLIETRASTLAGFGDWTEVQALLELVPEDQLTETLRRLRAESNLVANRISDACSRAQTALSTAPDVYWQKIQVFCQLDAGQGSAANLGLALLREQKVEDPVFFWAVDVSNGAQGGVPANFTRLEPLHYAILRKAQGRLPVNIADVQANIVDPATLGWLAGLQMPDDAAVKGDKTPPAQRAARRRAQEEARILLAERAVRAGTLPAATLRDIYASLNTKDPTPPPLTQITAEDVRGRAFLYQSAAAQTVPTARAEVLALALELVRADRGEKGPPLSVMGAVYADMLTAMEPTSDLVWFAGHAARALLAAGPGDKRARERAEAWLDLVRSMGRTSREAGQIAAGLWPVEAMLRESAASRLPPQALRSWMGSLPAETPAEVIALRHGTVLSLLTAVGEPVQATDWLGVVPGPARIDSAGVLAPHIWNGMTLAAKAGRSGETAAFALVAVGEDSPSQMALPSLQQVIESLRAAGRDEDARALAVEAALALGF